MTDATLMSAVFIGIIAGFYVMFMRPAQKENERHRQQIRDLRPGDDVLTTSGFIATVKDIQVPEKGQTRMADPPTDVWYRPYDRSDGVEEAMNQYLTWEVDLVAQVQRDGDARFNVLKM